MKKEFFSHKIAYLVLIIGLIIFAVSFLAVWPLRNLQRGMIGLMTIFYFLWGIFSHIKHDHIDKKIVLEYLVISLLGGLLLLLVTF